MVIQPRALFQSKTGSPLKSIRALRKNSEKQADTSLQNLLAVDFQDQQSILQFDTFDDLEDSERISKDQLDPLTTDEDI